MNADEAKVGISLELVVLLQKKVMVSEHCSGWHQWVRGPICFGEILCQQELPRQQEAHETNHGGNLYGM